MSRGGSSLMSGAILIDGGDVVVMVGRGGRWAVLIEELCWLNLAGMFREVALRLYSSYLCNLLSN